jgi:hypothetical protein
MGTLSGERKTSLFALARSRSRSRTAQVSAHIPSCTAATGRTGRSMHGARDFIYGHDLLVCPRIALVLRVNRLEVLQREH